MRFSRGLLPLTVGIVLAAAAAGCGSSSPSSAGAGGAASTPTGAVTASPAPATVGLGRNAAAAGSAKPAAGALRAGNPDGHAAVPVEARAVDTSRPTRVIGNGTSASCTSKAVVAAVAAGGVITFSCGPDPVTITMAATAKIKNPNGPKTVLDGGGKVTLSGAGQRRILYLNTCDSAQGFTTSHCQDQDHPQLTVQNLTFADGNSTGERAEGGGGGAIFFVSNDRTGTMRIESSALRRNRSDKFETRGFPGIFFRTSRPVRRSSPRRCRRPASRRTSPPRSAPVPGRTA